jgi:hypothetical protein
MSRSLSFEPIVGDWYSSYGELFEVVAVDEDEGMVEVQYADGTLAEIDAEDWNLRAQAGALRMADPPEDLNASIDVDDDDDARGFGAWYGDDASVHNGRLDGLDLFE